jgi:hypothetical protein
MKKFFTLTGLAFTLVTGAVGVAEAANNDNGINSVESTSYVNTIQIQSCNFWNYDMNARGYVCSGYPQNVTVPDGFATQQEFQQMQAKIDDLEARLRKLEGH